MEIVFIVSGIVVGLVIGLLLGKLKTSALSAKYEMKQGELVMVNKVLSEVNEETHELNRKIQEERDRRLTEVEAMREKMEAKAKEDTARQLKEQKAQYEQLKGPRQHRRAACPGETPRGSCQLAQGTVRHHHGESHRTGKDRHRLDA